MSVGKAIPLWDTDLPSDGVRDLSHRELKARIAASLDRKVAIMEGLASGADWPGPMDPPLSRTALRAWVDAERRLWPWDTPVADAVGGRHDALVRRFLKAVEAIRERRSSRRVPCTELLALEREASDRLRAQVIDLEQRLRESLTKRSFASGRGR